MKLLLSSIMLLTWSLSAKSLRVDSRGPAQFQDGSELYYNRCISSLYNHPHFLKASGGIQMGDQLELMAQLNDYCVCHAVEDIRQIKLFKAQKTAYFFINKKEYLAQLDICLQENVEVENRDEFFEVISTIKLAPILSEDIAKMLPGSFAATKHNDRGPSRECLEEQLVQACRETGSLFFLYRCFKRKIKDHLFFDQSYASCS